MERHQVRDSNDDDHQDAIRDRVNDDAGALINVIQSLYLKDAERKVEMSVLMETTLHRELIGLNIA